jgi:hypothetical protein
MAKYALRIQWLTVVGLVIRLQCSRASLINGVTGKLRLPLSRGGRGESDDMSKDKQAGRFYQILCFWRCVGIE